MFGTSKIPQKNHPERPVLNLPTRQKLRIKIHIALFYSPMQQACFCSHRLFPPIPHSKFDSLSSFVFALSLSVSKIALQMIISQFADMISGLCRMLPQL